MTGQASGVSLGFTHSDVLKVKTLLSPVDHGGSSCEFTKSFLKTLMKLCLCETIKHFNSILMSFSIRISYADIHRHWSTYTADFEDADRLRNESGNQRSFLSYHLTTIRMIV